MAEDIVARLREDAEHAEGAHRSAKRAGQPASACSEMWLRRAVNAREALADIQRLRASLSRAEEERDAARRLLGEAHWSSRAWFDLSADALGLNSLVAPIRNTTPGAPDWLMDWALMERIRDHLGGAEGLETYRPRNSGDGLAGGSSLENDNG